MNNFSIKAENLSKQYKLGILKHNTLRDQIADGVRSLFMNNGRSKTDKDKIWALNDVSFELKEGEVVGIIGHNGAGKTTLLKILSRITEPTKGRAEIHGRVGSLLEVGTGFHYELTGRENVYLSGAILGMTKAEIARKFDEIVAFSELEKFLDTPVKHYSSGMFVRLAFAVAAHLDPEILLVDEVLSVGDLTFQRKCMEKAARLRDTDASVVVVSHNMFTIKALCDRVLYLANGQLRFDGPSADAIALFEKDMLTAQPQLNTPRWAEGKIAGDPIQRAVLVTGTEIFDQEGKPCTVFDYGQRMRVRVKFEARETIPDLNVVICVIRSDNVSCCVFSSALDGFTMPRVSGDGAVEVLTPPLKLVSDLYTIQIVIWDKDFHRLYGAQIGSSFHVRHNLLSNHFGVFHESAEWFSASREDGRGEWNASAHRGTSHKQPFTDPLRENVKLSRS
jgi:lipopolysaccharide transport system ATP-binding protein